MAGNSSIGGPRPITVGGRPMVTPKGIENLGTFLGRATNGSRPDLYQYNSWFGTKTEPLTIPQMESLRMWEKTIVNYQKSYRTDPNNPQGTDIFPLLTDLGAPSLRSPEPLHFDAYSSQLRGYISRYREEMTKLNEASAPNETKPVLPVLSVVSKSAGALPPGYKLNNLVSAKEAAAKMASVGMPLTESQISQLRSNLPGIVLPEIVVNRLQAQLGDALNLNDLQSAYIQRALLIANAMDGYRLENGTVVTKAEVMKAFGMLDQRNVQMGIYTGAVPPEFYTPKPATMLDELSDVFPPPLQNDLPGKMRSHGHRIA
jgi:hypothetical protein